MTLRLNEEVRSISSVLTITHTIECGNCGVISQFSNAESSWSAATLFYSRGWRVNDNENVRCPECVKYGDGFTRPTPTPPAGP